MLPAMLFSAQSAGQLFSLAPEIARAKAAVISISKLLVFRPSILGLPATEKPSASCPSTGSSPSISSQKEQDVSAAISFKDVSLSYANLDGNIVLKNVSLTFYEGSRLHWSVYRGQGSHSAVSLVERFYDVNAGSVRIDGIDIRELDVDQVRSRIRLVSQEADLLPGSIAYNIRLGTTATASSPDIRDVCRRCGLHDFIQSLPEGYNTECGSGASSKLSGGQKQRIALARALRRKPEILLLDEPTSALDASSEALIPDTLKQAAEGVTTITVAHRLASIRDADRIIVMDAGRVVEQGTHGELMAVGGLYAGMAKAQSLA